jgi:GNAT superfamily N-acetyltransferase
MTKSELAIRPFAVIDLPRLQEIRAAAFRPVFKSFRDIVGEAISARAFATADADQAAYPAGICRPDSGQRVFVALMASEIIGFVSVSLDQAKRIGEIGLSAVHPFHAGQGVGSRLYGFAISLMRDEGILWRPPAPEAIRATSLLGAPTKKWVSGRACRQCLYTNFSDSEFASYGMVAQAISGKTKSCPRATH